MANTLSITLPTGEVATARLLYRRVYWGNRPSGFMGIVRISSAPGISFSCDVTRVHKADAIADARQLVLELSETALAKVCRVA